MLSKDEFVRWVIASHDLFEIFEGRYDAYPLARKWINEWFLNGKFTFKDSKKKNETAKPTLLRFSHIFCTNRSS